MVIANFFQHHVLIVANQSHIIQFHTLNGLNTNSRLLGLIIKSRILFFFYLSKINDFMAWQPEVTISPPLRVIVADHSIMYIVCICIILLSFWKSLKIQQSMLSNVGCSISFFLHLKNWRYFYVKNWIIMYF